MDSFASRLKGVKKSDSKPVVPRANFPTPPVASGLLGKSTGSPIVFGGGLSANLPSPAPFASYSNVGKRTLTQSSQSGLEMTTSGVKFSVDKFSAVSIMPTDIGHTYCGGLINPKGGGKKFCAKVSSYSSCHDGKDGCEVRSHMTTKMEVGNGGIYLVDVGSGYCEPCIDLGGLTKKSQKLICDMEYTCEHWAHVVAGVSAFSPSLSEEDFEIQLKKLGERLIISSPRKNFAPRKRLRYSQLTSVIDELLSANNLIDFDSATFSENVMDLLATNFASIAARSHGTLVAVKQIVTAISEDIDVHEDSISQVGVSLGSPGNIGSPSVWKGLGDQIKGMQDLEVKLRKELRRISKDKAGLSTDLESMVKSTYDVVMGRRGLQANMDNDIGPTVAMLRKLYHLVTSSEEADVGDLLEKIFSKIEDLMNDDEGTFGGSTKVNPALFRSLQNDVESLEKRMNQDMSNNRFGEVIRGGDSQWAMDANHQFGRGQKLGPDNRLEVNQGWGNPPPMAEGWGNSQQGWGQYKPAPNRGGWGSSDPGFQWGSSSTPEPPFGQGPYDKHELDALKMEKMMREQPAQRDGGDSGAKIRDIIRVDQRITDVDRKVDVIESRAGAQSAVFGGIPLRSKLDCEKFVAQYLPGGSWAGFYDVVSLLSKLPQGYTSDAEQANTIHAYQKIKWTSDEAVIAISFKNEIPAVLGHGGAAASATNAPLPAIKTYKAWNPGNGIDGVKLKITNGIHDLQSSLRSHQDSLFKGGTWGSATGMQDNHKAHELARVFLEDSVLFINDLFGSFMDSLYTELNTTSNAGEAESWLLVASSVRAIFSWIRKSRNLGQDADSDLDKGKQCATYLWATVQTHLKMKELRELEFRKHNIIASAINFHMLQHRVPMTVFHKLEGDHKSLKALVEEKSKLLDRVYNEFKALKNKVDNQRGGGGRGGGNGGRGGNSGDD